MTIELKRGVAAVSVALGLALGGCGGGDEDEALTKSELAKQAGDICDRGEKRLNALRPPADFQTNPTSAAKFLGQFLPIADDTVGDLKALKPPEDLQGAYDDYIKRQESAVNSIRTAQQKAEKRDPTGLRDLQKVANESDRIDALANKAGVPRCAD